jgi:hypothetical protein
MLPKDLRHLIGESLLLLFYAVVDIFEIWPWSHFWAISSAVLVIWLFIFMHFWNKAGMMFGCIFAAVGIFIFYINPYPPEPPPWRGWLQAANDPTPINACDNPSTNAPAIPWLVVPKDAPVMVAGMGGVRLTRPGKNRVISIGSCEALIFERAPDGIRVNAPLFDDAGNPLGEIIDNGYQISKEPSLVVEHSGDLSTLVIHDKSGSELLYIHYANPHAIKVRGKFHCPSLPGVIVTITDEEIRFGPVTIRGGCFNRFSRRGCINCVRPN